MHIFSRFKSWTNIAIDTALITPRRLRSIDQQLKVITQMKDGVFSFVYKDTTIRFALPDVCRDTIQTNILDTGTFCDINNLERIRKYIQPGSVIADCGANIGNHMVFFAKICRAQTVFAFEPQKHCFDIVTQQIKLNGLENSVKPQNVALGDKIGAMIITNCEQGNSGGTRFGYSEPSGYSKSDAISAITLDSLNLPQLDFMKIDVEGAQLSLLEGAKETLLRCAPTIWVELLGKEAYDIERERTRPQNLLKDLGYTLSEMLSETDFVYCKHRR